MTLPSIASLRLAEHVRACCADGQVILLDLQRSRYIRVGGAQLPALARAIHGWPVSPDCPLRPGTPADIEPLTAPLRAQGLVTRATITAGAAAPTIAVPLRSLNAEDAMHGAAIGWRRLGRFLTSAITASAWLRWRSLASIARLVAARRARLATPDGPASPDAIRKLVASYLRLRPFAFSAHDRCLHDSLSLMHFLAGEGVFANWVIGVRTQPFGAHSWVQRGDTVLNDQHERVRRYQPILVV